MPEHRGDRSLADLARERGTALTRYAYLLTGDSAAAQDLVQDAFVKVFARTRTGFSPDVAEAYVRRAILTTYVDGYRRRQRWASVRHLLASDEHRDSPETTSADKLDVRVALSGLTPRERVCVILRFYEDLTVPEIAAELELSAGTIKRYLSNAVHKLETELGPMPALRVPAADIIQVSRPASSERN